MRSLVCDGWPMTAERLYHQAPMVDATTLSSLLSFKALSAPPDGRGGPGGLGLGDAELGRLAELVELCEVQAGDELGGDPGVEPALYLVLDGQFRLRRGALRLGLVGPGGHFGELDLLGGRAGPVAAVCVAGARVARLPLQTFQALCEREPPLALALLRGLTSGLGVVLSDTIDTLGTLLRERSLPRRLTVDVSVGSEVRRVRAGTPARLLLACEEAGPPVVAALLGSDIVSLDTPLTADATLAPLTTEHWEGRRVYRATLGLALLEAAFSVEPEARVELGPTIGYARWVVRTGGALLPAQWVERVTHKMALLAAVDAPVRKELWTVEEARGMFEERGDHGAALLLRTRRERLVTLVSCGSVFALGISVLLPSLGMLARFPLRLEVSDGGFLLYYGDGQGALEALPSRVLHVPPPSSAAPLLEPEHRPLLPRRGRSGDEPWLEALDVGNVGAFNRACIVGSVPQIIRVCEGLHEKRIGQIADTIAAGADQLRIICIAGPSSSGKTTFIKRLTVQLQVNGVLPVALSLDDYYLDREKTARDENGEYDFEALEALDLRLLEAHLGAILRGEVVNTARFDFPTGRSHPEGGPRIGLRPSDVLMLEGIHGLNPRLIGGAAPRAQVFRIFIQPMSGLPFDALSTLSPSDIRLLRRIVRDRHGRGTSAADTILRWPSVRRGERAHIFPFLGEADAHFDSGLIYEPSVAKVYAERYLLEVPEGHAAHPTATRLRDLIDRFVAIYPEHVPPTSILREFIGGSSFEY